MFKQIILFTLILLLCSITHVFAQSNVKLAWDASTSTDVTGYRLFQRAEGGSYNFNSPVWEGSALTCTINGLADNQKFHFVVRAFDSANNPSGNSNEVTYINDIDAPTPPSGLSATKVE